MDYLKLIEDYGLATAGVVWLAIFVSRIISKGSFTFKYPADKTDDKQAQ